MQRQTKPYTLAQYIDAGCPTLTRDGVTAVGTLLVLTGKNVKGKNRLREAHAAMPGWDGSWRVQNELEQVTFAPSVRGPWLFVAPRCADSVIRERYSRWVHANADDHFDVAAA